MKLTTNTSLEIIDLYGSWITIVTDTGFGFAGHLDASAPGGWAYTLHVPAALQGSIEGELLIWAGLTGIAIAIDIANTEKETCDAKQVQSVCTIACCIALAGVRRELLDLKEVDQETQQQLGAFLLMGLTRTHEETFGRMRNQQLPEYESKFEALLECLLFSFEARRAQSKDKQLQNTLQELLRTVKPDPRAN